VREERRRREEVEKRDDENTNLSRVILTHTKITSKCR
jgi:hypothetical protein